MKKRKSFKTLIKLQKTFVDEQRQQLARLYDYQEKIEAQIAQFQIMKVKEQELAARNPALKLTYGAFVKALIIKERALENERQRAALAVKIAQDKLAELFEEQKRYEIAEEQRLEEEAKEERRLETIMLDEVGGVMHERERRG